MAFRSALRRLVVTLLSVACLAPVTSLAARAEAATDYAAPAFGVQFHGMWSSYSDAQRQQVLDELKNAGVHWLRLDLGWAMLQPTSRDSYDLGWGVPFTDSVIDKIHADGFHLLVTFWRTPGWANGGAGETALPTDPADYANALQWAAARYAGKVDAWEIWNEPNMTYSMAGADPAQYAALLRAAYPAAHRGDPATQVVFGGPSENDVPWIQKAYAAGAGGNFDVMATHPYMGPSNAAPDTPDDGTIYKLTHVSAVHDLMVANGDGAKPIWFTEFGWSSHANTAGMANWELGVSPQQQGDYLVQTLQLLQQQYPYVTNAFWYEANDQNTGTTANIDNYGLLDSNLAPKPAYDAVKTYLATATTSTTSTSTTTTTTSTSTTTTPTTAPATAPVTVVSAPTATSYDAPAVVSASVSTTDGAPVAGAAVAVDLSAGSTGWRRLSTVQTSNTGVASVTVRQPRTFQIKFTYANRSVTRRVVVTPKVAVHASRTTVRRGHVLILRGRLAPHLAGLIVRRETHTRSGWHVVGRTRTTRGGYYRFRVVPARRAHLVYRVTTATQRGLSAGRSATLRVRVV